MLDLAPLDGSDPEANFATIEHELELHDQRLARLPRILALSKADLVQPRSEAADGRARLGRSGCGEDVPVLRHLVARRARASTSWPPSCCAACRCATPAAEQDLRGRRGARRAPRVPAGRAARLPVERVEDGLFRVEGDAVDRLIARHDLDNEDALIHVEGRLRRMGVIRALEAAGFEPGDDVEIAGIVFELDPG